MSWQDRVEHEWVASATYTRCWTVRDEAMLVLIIERMDGTYTVIGSELPREQVDLVLGARSPSPGEREPPSALPITRQPTLSQAMRAGDEHGRRWRAAKVKAAAPAPVVSLAGRRKPEGGS